MTEIPFPMQALASELLEELQSERLEVTKIPGRDGGYIRAVITQNPEWYQRLCERHQGRRRRFPRSRTIIKRQDTLRVLRQLAEGDSRPTLYQERLLGVLEQEAKRRWQVHGKI